MEQFKSWEKAGSGLWAGLEEDASGRLRKISEEEGGDEYSHRRRKRAQENETRRAVAARGFLRYLVVVVDASAAAGVVGDNMRPSRLVVTCDCVAELIRDYIASNPLCSACVAECRDGGASLATGLSSSERSHTHGLESIRKRSPSGLFSVEAALTVCAKALASTPDYGSREVLFVVSALATTDSGDVFEQCSRTLKNVRVSVISLAAETRVLKKLANDAKGTFGVALDKTHFQSLLGAHIPPPALAAGQKKTKRKAPPLVLMGFPSFRVEKNAPKLTLAADGSQVWSSQAYSCPTCHTRVPKLPTTCPTCELPLVTSAHLAASHHHLFPVRTFAEKEVDSETKYACFGCQTQIGGGRDATDDGDDSVHAKKIFSYRCPNCQNTFCATCDEFVHTSLHNCPGCERTS